MIPTGDEIGTEATPGAELPRWAWMTFGVLFAMNLLDYMDRHSLSGVMPQLLQPPDRGGLGLSTDQAGRLTTYFLVSYSVFSPIMGWAGDRMRRTWLLGLGIGLWSLATVGSGLARSYGQLVFARSLMGVGEATYGIIAPTLLADLFPRAQRSRILSGFYLAMPLGTALGIAVGGNLGARFGWQTAFFVVGAPALAAALGALVLPEPPRGASEEVDPDRVRAHDRAGASWDDYMDLVVNSSFTYSVLGQAFYTFAIGGLVVWVPYFLVNTRAIPQDRASNILGLVTLGAASTGMMIGGWVSDRLARVDPRALFIVPGLAMLASIPFVVAGLLTKSPPWIFAAIFAAEALMFVNTGPLNAVIANVVTPNLRATAFAILIAGVHVLGDFWSPWLVGWVARTFGQPDTMATPFGRALAAIGAVPTRPPGQPPENFVAGLLVVVPALALSGAVLLAGARHLPREMALMLAKLKAAPGPQR